jgi:hypothetical protein
VDETLNPPAADIPPADTAAHGGSFLGIPFGWPMLVAVIILIAVMWMAREPMRRVVWQIFFTTGRVFGRWGLWLSEHGKAARVSCSEKIAAHHAEELIDRMLVLEDRIGKRATKLPQEAGPIIARLDTSTHKIDQVASTLAEINVEDAAERAFRAALPRMEEGRGLHKIEKNMAQSTARAMQERLAPVRPALSMLKTEAPRVIASAEKLGKIEQRFTQGVDTVNKTFADFEETLRSPDRIKVAGKQSIVIPWLIALIITGIALSGVFLNFFLIKVPMAEIVGEGARIGGVGLPDFAAIIVIFLEFVAGVILMDAAGFTRLIPAFHSMSDGGRRIMFWVAFLFLLAFSFLEATLAIVREQIIEANAATRDIANSYLLSPELAATAQGAADQAAAADPSAADAAVAAKPGIQLATLAQLVLAVVIPWLLATAALPLETIVRNSVFMAQIAGGYFLLILAFICKTIAVALKNVGLFALAIYDLIIFAPLWVERRIKGTHASGSEKPRPPPAEKLQKREAQPERRKDKDREQELQKAS